MIIADDLSRIVGTILPFVLPIAAIVVASLTLYLTHLRGPKVQCAPLKYLGFWRQDGARTYIGTALYLSNAGAKPAHVWHLHVELAKGRQRFACEWTTEYQLRRLPNAVQAGIVSLTSPSAIPTPFSIQPKSGLLKECVFLLGAPGGPPIGDMTLEAYVTLAGKKKPILVSTSALNVANVLKDGEVVDAVRTGSTAKFEIPPKGSL